VSIKQCDQGKPVWKNINPDQQKKAHFIASLSHLQVHLRSYRTYVQKVSKTGSKYLLLP
jgi:hypothetical protein